MATVKKMDRREASGQCLFFPLTSTTILTLVFTRIVLATEGCQEGDVQKVKGRSSSVLSLPSIPYLCRCLGGQHMDGDGQ